MTPPAVKLPKPYIVCSHCGSPARASIGGGKAKIHKFLNKRCPGSGKHGRDAYAYASYQECEQAIKEAHEKRAADLKVLQEKYGNG
jgi:hypothetical protein